MSELFFGGGAGWFSAPAIIGTIFFVIRLTMLFVGGGDLDVDADVDVDVGDADTDVAFKVLSVQSVAAFLMGFGWGGLGAFRGTGLGVLSSIVVGLAAGTGMMLLLGKLLQMIHKFHSSGTLPIHRALYCEGTVYAQIPATGQGMGEISVVIDDRQRYYRAVSDDAPIETSTKVRVVDINDDNSVTVTRV